MRVLIVGAGVVGLSTAWALVGEGHEVAVYEQGSIPNPAAASFDQHRLMRLPYGDQAGYCLMAGRAFASWQRLWKDLGEEHYEERGSLSISSEPGDWTDRSRATLQRFEIPYRVLEGEKLAECAPFLKLPKDAWGLYNERGGVLFAERILDGLAEYLDAMGVELHRGARVENIDLQGASLSTGDGRSDWADALLVAAGAWTPKLRPELMRRALAHRQAVIYLDPPRSRRAQWESAPILLDLGRLDCYAAPPADGTALKFGIADHRRPCDPDALAPIAEGEPEAIFRRIAPFLAEADGYRIREARVCPYAVAPDANFVVEAIGPSLIVTGCTGHMFKFGALMGEALGETLIGKRDREAFLNWARGRAA